MNGVRVLVGTRKGAFILTSDGTRNRWTVSGPHFGGWEIYHLKGSPADPNRLYASQTSGWFGQVLQRSSDAGQTWETVGNKFTYEGVTGTHQWYDGTPHPWEFKRVWHLEPSLTDPDTVYAGVEDAAFFKSTAGGRLTRGCSRSTSRIRKRRSATASTGSRSTDPGRTWCSCRSTGTSCARTTPGTCGAKSAATCRRILASSSTSTLTSPRRSTWCRSRAIRNTIQSTDSCARSEE